MTDLVEWIEPFLGDSYRQQVDSNRRSAHPDHSAKSRIETEFDISNLYIRQEVRQRVQVIELRDVADCLRATVCDKSNIVDAQISGGFEADSKKVTAQLLSKLAPGDILELRRIELRVTDDFEPCRTTLWITDFEFLGNASGVEVSQLKRLDSLPRVRTLLRSYFNLKPRTPLFSAMDVGEEFKSQAGSPPAALLSDSDIENQDPRGSQLEFSTQVPTKHRQKPPYQSPIKKRANTTADLQRLLSESNKRRRIAEHPQKSHLYERTAAHLPAPADLARGIPRTDNHEESVGKTSPATNPQPSPVLQSQVIDQVSAIETTPTILKHFPRDAADHGNDHGSEAMATSSPKTAATVPKQGEGCPAVNTDPFASLRGELVMGRFLPSRLFKVPHDQEKLLESEASWQPPKVGQPAPNGCIPPKLLERLVEASEKPEPNHMDAGQGVIENQSSGISEGDSEPDAADHDVELPTIASHAPLSGGETGTARAFEQSLDEDDDDLDDEQVDSEQWPESSPISKRILPPDSHSGSPVTAHTAPEVLHTIRQASAERSDKDARISSTAIDRGNTPHIVIANGMRLAEKSVTQASQTTIPTCAEPASTSKEEPVPSAMEPKPHASSIFHSQDRIDSLSNDFEEDQDCMRRMQSKIEVKETPLIKSKSEIASSRTRIDGDTEVMKAVCHVPATFGHSQSQTTPRDMPASQHEPENTQGLRRSPEVLEEQDGIEEAVSQQLLSEIEEQCGHSDSNLIRGLNGDTRASDQKYQQISPTRVAQDTSPQYLHNGWGSSQATDHAPFSTQQAKPLAKTSSLVSGSQTPTLSPHSAPRDPVTMAQAARRDYFKNLREGTKPSETSTLPISPVQQSSKASVQKRSSEVEASKIHTFAPGIARGPSRISSAASSKSVEDVFAAFCGAYPLYNGKLVHFHRICQMIQKLRKDRKALHAFLWDDFIYRHRREYLNYQIEQAEAALEIQPYIDFYTEVIEAPEFTKGIVRPDFIDSLVPDSTQTRSASATPPGNVGRPGPITQLWYAPSNSATQVTDSKGRDIYQSITADSSASDILPRHAQAGTELPSSPPCLSIPAVDNGLPETQSSVIKSWLHKASGHESPELGNSDKEPGIQKVTELELNEIQESDEEEREVLRRRSSPPIASIARISSPAVASDKKEARREEEVVKQDRAGTQVKAWWHDRNTPFKEWARAHESMARRRQLGKNKLQTDQYGTILPMVKKHVDIGQW